MSLKPYLFPYQMYSESATALARALNTKKVYPDRNFRFRDTHLVVNWGHSEWPRWFPREAAGRANFDTLHRFLNIPPAVNRALDKKLTFVELANYDAFNSVLATINLPPYTDSRAVAEEWLSIEGGVVVCRQTTTGHGGEGIVLAERVEEIVDAPLYTRYIPKKHEYRVHVFNKQIIDFAQKKRKLDVPDDQVNWKIRSHDNGWIFAKQDVVLPDGFADMAKAAVEGLGLDFGAVDMIHSTLDGKPYVLEVNSAPGIEGSTLDHYAAAIRAFCEEA